MRLGAGSAARGAGARRAGAGARGRARGAGRAGPGARGQCPSARVIHEMRILRRSCVTFSPVSRVPSERLRRGRSPTITMGS